MRTIIHIDMDCFYAAIEMRERPELAGKPVAVGGSSGRGVLTTANYEARKYGCRSAMPAFKALRLCPELIIVPVRFDLYRAEARRIREIFGEFSPWIEPLSLDEAYLDVTHLRSLGANVAAEIRARIWETSHLTASAGIAPNKFLAKVASDWRKPNGQFEVKVEEVASFVANLPVRKIWGVGARTAERLEAAGAKTCGDLQAWDLGRLSREFGKFGVQLYQLCRGEDDRAVRTDRVRKSMSCERTFSEDLETLEVCREALEPLLEELSGDLAGLKPARRVAKAVVKMKFSDFKSTTAECGAGELDRKIYDELLREAWGRREGRKVRLLGAGVRFALDEGEAGWEQLEFELVS